MQRLRRALRHPVTNSVIGLYGIQIATFLIPLATLPYVARVLDPSDFGLVVLGQGLAFTLLVLVDWGFGLAGVRSVASHQDDPEALAAVVKRIRGAQLVLAALCGLVAASAVLVIPAMAANPEFLILAYIAAVTTGLAPDWYFQGMERVRLIAVIQLGFRTLGAALTFVLVKGPEDAWIVMALFAASSVGVLVVSDILLRRDIPVRRASLRASLAEIRAGSMLFVGGLALTLYTSLNVVLLGLFASSAAVAHFGAAERLVRVSIMLLGPIGAAVMPRMTALHAAGETDRARKLLVIALAVGGGPALLFAAGLVVFAEPIVGLVYGEDFVDEAAEVLQIIALIIPISVIGVVCAFWLITLHRDRIAVLIVAIAGVTNVIAACVLAPRYGPVGMAWSVVLTEGVAAVGALIAVRLVGREYTAAS